MLILPGNLANIRGIAFRHVMQEGYCSDASTGGGKAVLALSQPWGWVHQGARIPAE